MIVALVVFSGFVSFVCLFSPLALVVKAEDGNLQNLGANSSVSIPFSNIIVKDLSHDYPNIGEHQSVTVLSLFFSNGENEATFSYHTRPRNYLNGGGIYWTYESRWSDMKYADIIAITNTGLNLIITDNPYSENVGLFNNVTIRTFDSTITVYSYTAVIEFDVTFQTTEGQVISVVRTVEKYLPSNLIPVAPELAYRPFQRWVNISGYKIDEIITSDCTFLPLYSYNPDLTIKEPSSDSSVSGFFSDNIFLIPVVLVAVLIIFIFLRGAFK